MFWPAAACVSQLPEAAGRDAAGTETAAAGEPFGCSAGDFPGGESRLSQFRGSSSGEFCAWLRKILVNNLHRVVEKHVLAAKRDVRREVSLENMATNLEESTARLEAILPDQGTSPSSHAQRHEMEIVLADHLAELPHDYRDVIVLRHLESLPFEAIGQRMERSAGAARMLWLRAIQALRERMDG